MCTWNSYYLPDFTVVFYRANIMFMHIIYNKIKVVKLKDALDLKT